ncbi:hypothetical protein AY599_08895 [Leptolyngbya valderiana BDU 20041]|nr:hypothetical protein AY599_08895 [Leptolyngbya valderiana BDU 20041]
MTRKHHFVLAAIPLAILAIAAFVAWRGLAPATQTQAPRAQAQAPRPGTPADRMTWSGDFDLVEEIRQRRAEANRAEKARAEADGEDTPSIAYLRAVRAIWDDDRLRDAPAIAEVGLELTRIHAYRHDYGRMHDACVEVLAVIDANRERWLAMATTEFLREQMARHIDTTIITICSRMQSGSNQGRPHIELAALERIIAMETNEKNRENFIMQRDDVRARMARGQHGPENPPNRWPTPTLPDDDG